MANKNAFISQERGEGSGSWLSNGGIFDPKVWEIKLFSKKVKSGSEGHTKETSHIFKGNSRHFVVPAPSQEI